MKNSIDRFYQVTIGDMAKYNSMVRFSGFHNITEAADFAEIAARTFRYGASMGDSKLKEPKDTVIYVHAEYYVGEEGSADE